MLVPWRVWTRLREATYPGPKDTFEDYFPVPKVGYLSSLRNGPLEVLKMTVSYCSFSTVRPVAPLK